MKKTYLTFSLIISIIQFPIAQNSLLWKISGDKLGSTSFLYGTIHVSDKRFTHLHPKVISALDTSDLFAMELIMDSVDMFDFLGKISMDSSLKNLIDEDSYKILSDHFNKNVGLPISLFDRIHPLFISFAFFEDHNLENDTIPVLDLYLYKLARRKGKKVRGLETADEQIDAITSIPLKEQAELLEAEIRSLQKDETGTERLIDLYLKADLDQIMQISEEYNLPEKFRKLLLYDRNKIMMDRMIKIMERYSSFIAVGALHLPGEEGLIELLRDKGYEVESVPIVR